MSSPRLVNGVANELPLEKGRDERIHVDIQKCGENLDLFFGSEVVGVNTYANFVCGDQWPQCEPITIWLNTQHHKLPASTSQVVFLGQ